MRKKGTQNLFLNQRMGGLASESGLWYDPYQWFETRFDGNGADPDGTTITAVGGGNPDVTDWEDLNVITTKKPATGVATRYPHWTQSVFLDGAVAGVDFSVNGATSCQMTHTNYVNNIDDDRMIFAYALKRVGTTGSMWINRKDTTDGISLASNEVFMEWQNGGFLAITDSGWLTSAQAAAEPFIIIIEGSAKATGSPSNVHWYCYYANTTDTSGLLVDATSATPLLENGQLDFAELGTDQDTALGRTNFLLGAQMIFRSIPPKDTNRTPGPNDDVIQNIFTYLKTNYLDAGAGDSFYLLEDGTSNYLLENGTDKYILE